MLCNEGHAEVEPCSKDRRQYRCRCGRQWDGDYDEFGGRLCGQPQQQREFCCCDWGSSSAGRAPDHESGGQGLDSPLLVPPRFF